MNLWLYLRLRILPLQRKFYPNLHKKKFFIPEVDRWVTLKVSTEAMRNINKKGIYAYLNQLQKKGDIKLILED